MSAEKFAIIGLGHFGFSVAKNLAARGAEVLAIDKDMRRVEMIKDDVAYAAALDATDFKALNSQNIAEMDAVLVAIGENIEGLLLTTVQLLEMKAKRIIARAVSSQQRIILEKLGVKEILSPEDEVAVTMTERLLNPNMLAYLPLPDGYQIVELRMPKRIVSKTVGEIGFSDNFQIDLIALKRKYEEFTPDKRKITVDHLLKKPKRDTILEAADILVCMAKTQDLDKFTDVNKV